MERLTGLVRRSHSVESQEEEEPGEDADDRVETRLYYCADCDVTFVNREMESCPRCDQAVEQVPNEQDLDRFHIH